MATKMFRVGFGEVDITPKQSVKLAGYYYPRQSTGVHDRLKARAMVVSDGKNSVALCAVDLIFINADMASKARKLVAKQCGIPASRVIFSAVHTHTGPDLNLEKKYIASIPALLAKSIRLAQKDLAPRPLRVARGQEKTVQFVRRYRMKDGSVRTNPGLLNPDVKAPIGTPDRDLHLLLAGEKDSPVGGLAHFALHCDTVGGDEISADWTYYLRECVREKLGANLSLLTPIGPCGDINHWNVFAPGSLRGFAETERIGRAIGQAALKAAKKAAPVRFGPVRGFQQQVELATRMPTQEELAAAKQLLAQPPPQGVDFTMDRVIARRQTRVADMGPRIRIDVTVVSFGNVAVVGIPAEYFTSLGRRIKKASPFDYTIVCALSNGIVSYIGAAKNYKEGGYETTSSLVVPGSGEQIADTAIALLKRAARS